MSRQSERFNILLITTDTQRTDTVACYGNPHALSPNLDRLAREGVLFEQGHTPSPVCMPARCSLMTGVHTPVHGCIENGVQRHTHLPLLPDLLAAQGYTNIMVGKTHFGPVPDSFSVQHVLRGEKHSGSDDFYAQHLRQHGYDRSSRHPNTIPEELFCESFLVDTTIREIERVAAPGQGRQGSQPPFFAFCSMLSPHEPFDPPGRWATIYDDRPLPPLNYVPGEEQHHPRHLRTLLGMDELERLHRLPNGQPDLEQIDAERRLYYGSAAYCDAQVGRLLDYLDQSGLRQNTLVIFTSDHGTQLYDHGFKDKHNYYDASWRVPFILSLPGTLPEGERRDFAIWNDLTATILAAAGTASSTMQAFDLFTPLKKGQPSPRRCAVGTLYKSCALATQRWKLEYFFEEGTGRLFDRVNDPLERTDVYDNPRFRDVRQELLQALLTWRADILDVSWLQEHTGTGGPVATRLADYTRSMHGTDPERRLNERVEAIEDRYGTLTAVPAVSAS